MTNSMTYTATNGELVLTLEAAEEGGYVVTSPLDPELITEAETLEEAFLNAADASLALKESTPAFQIKLEPLAVDVSVTEDAIRVVLADGREVSVPLEWSVRLRNATAEQRKNWRLIGDGIGIHWEDVDEDISVVSLLSTE